MGRARWYRDSNGPALCLRRTLQDMGDGVGYRMAEFSRKCVEHGIPHPVGDVLSGSRVACEAESQRLTHSVRNLAGVFP